MQPLVSLIDDDADLRRAMKQTLELAGLSVTAHASAAEALETLEPAFEGIVVSDIRMPGMDGLALFRRIAAFDPDLPVILVTGHGDIPMAVQALKDGVYDFIPKPFAAERLVQSVRRALEKRRLVMENRALKRAAETAGDSLPLIGQTPVMERLRQTIRHIADTDVDVLVAGETGSGKEVVATLLHNWSRRRSGNFVALNCGALPETVIESELFGHEAGAFTGALKKRVGRIEHASGGTLFLDEIEAMPPATQVKMLRVLEAREVSPLGTNQVRPVDIRVIAAAKIDLGNPAERGAFREDLYFRLNVVTLSIPPLRERRDDMPLLFSHFLTRAAERFRRDTPTISPAVQRHLMEHAWPGNVRELAHFAERVALGVEGSLATPRMLASQETEALPERLERYEAEILKDVLRAQRGDVKATIEALGIPRKTFYDKLQRHGINRADYAERGIQDKSDR
ncbi:sigma-54 dependent transcriptional regulator [Ensifer sp.]|jgi:two-component system C4-dicarboxylate transport response regulator DctD|uniref:sigma-54-dependent transcriptional regulator n=1 Tax=Ensifer sp. TaxID=1872086 RepID=UPI002E14E840|nr:sigma-54 dependent transcriptional regulator [Ensifer sp.]